MTDAFDPSQHSAGILHIGPGAFHRAHQAVYTEDAMVASGGDWAIEAVSMHSTAVADALNAQGAQYILAIRGTAGTDYRPVRSIKSVHAASRGFQPVAKALHRADTRVVSLTVTEKGYIAQDGARFAPIIGRIATALAHRRAEGVAPFSVMSCDNLADNGTVLRQAVLEAAAILVPDCVDHIANDVAFPSTMVDRITPATTPALLAEVLRETGFSDQAPVETEEFSQWVIEDHFISGRPDWAAAGALFVSDVAPYERMKLRMLNGAHSMLAYVGFAMGKRYVRDVMADPLLAALVDRQIAAAAQTIDPMPGIDLDAYRGALIARFRNPHIAHETFQIAMDGSQKMPQRMFAPALDALERAQDIAPFAFATAAWMHHIAGATDDGTGYALRDPLEPQLTALPDQPTDRYLALCGLAGVVPKGLAANAAFRLATVGYLSRMTEAGMAQTVAEVINA